MKEKFARAIIYKLSAVNEELLQEELENLNVFESINKITDEVEVEFTAGERSLSVWKNRSKAEAQLVLTLGSDKKVEERLIWDDGKPMFDIDLLKNMVGQFIEHMKQNLSDFQELTFTNIETVEDLFQALSLISEFPEIRFTQTSSFGMGFWKTVRLDPEEVEVNIGIDMQNGWKAVLEEMEELVSHVMRVKVPSVQDVFSRGISLENVIRFFLAFSESVYVNPFGGSGKAIRLSLDCEPWKCSIRVGAWSCEKNSMDRLKKVLKIENWEDLSSRDGFYIMGKFLNGSTVIISRGLVSLTAK